MVGENLTCEKPRYISGLTFVLTVKEILKGERKEYNKWDVYLGKYECEGAYTNKRIWVYGACDAMRPCAKRYGNYPKEPVFWILCF